MKKTGDNMIAIVQVSVKIITFHVIFGLVLKKGYQIAKNVASQLIHEMDFYFRSKKTKGEPCMCLNLSRARFM